MLYSNCRIYQWFVQSNESQGLVELISGEYNNLQLINYNLICREKFSIMIERGCILNFLCLGWNRSSIRSSISKLGAETPNRRNLEGTLAVSSALSPFWVKQRSQLRYRDENLNEKNVRQQGSEMGTASHGSILSAAVLAWGSWFHFKVLSLLWVFVSHARPDTTRYRTSRFVRIFKSHGSANFNDTRPKKKKKADSRQLESQLEQKNCLEAHTWGYKKHKMRDSTLFQGRRIRWI